ATTCQCEALNRIFQPSDGWCVCDAFHEFFDESFVRRSEEDGTEPCQPQVYDVCFQGEARQSDTGKCLDMDTACAGQCDSGQGTYDGRTGLCDCADQTPLREICDTACQLTAPRMRLDATTGLLRMETLVSVGPTESQNVYNTTLLRMEDVPGFLTDGLVCVDGLADGLNTQDPATAERFIVTQLSEAELQAAASSNAGACTVQSVIMTEQGFTGQYGTSPRVLDTLTDAYTLPVAAFNSSGAANSSTARRLLSGDEEGPLSPLLDLDNTVRMSLALQGLLRSDTALAPSAAARYLLGLQQLPLHLAHARIAVPRSVMEALPLDAWQGAEVASLPTQSRRRRLQRPTSAAAFTDSPLVANPLMCIRLGDSVMWDLRGGDSNYPVYLKDSLLNTNPSFDYGRFRRLSTAMKSTANVTSFGYSFTEPGTYVFGNAGNPSHKLIVTVMESGSTCPTEGPIEPMRVERVNQVGARRNDDVFLEINRSMALAISLSFLVLVLALVAGFAYFHTLPWEESNLGRVTYRDKGRTSSILALHKTTAAAATQAERDASKGAASISVPAEGQESKSAPSGAAVSLEDGSNSDSDGDVVVVEDGTAHLLTATDDAAMISATKKDSQEATGQWTNVAEAVLARRSGLVGDVTRMDVADMDLVNVLESLESHQDALSAGFLDQERQVRVVEKTIHSEADSIKRMLGTAAYERQMRDALYTPEDDAVRVAAAKRVMAELRRQDGFQGALAKAQSRLLDALLELTDQLKPGAVQLAEVSVDQLRADEVQLSHEDEDGARIVVDLNGDSVIGAVRDGVMKLQAAVDQCAKLVDDDRVRAAGDAPMWRLVSALGLGNARAVSSALEGARAGEENLAETLRRLMESLEPFADTAPGLQTELHATVSEFGRLLAGTTHVPSVADLIHIRARRAQHAAATAGSRRTSISSTTSQSGTRRPSLAIPQEPDFALGPELGSDDEGGMRNPLEADDGEAASGSASSPGSSRRSVSKFDVEASELIDRSEVQWLDQEEYVQEIDSSSKRVASRLRLLYTDLAHVLSMLYAQVPKMHDDCMDLLVSVRKHQASLRDELHDFVESQAGTAGDVADEDEPGLGDDDLLKYLQQLDHVLHGHVVLKDGNVASTDGIVPLKTAAALLGREQTSTSSTRQPDAGGAGEIFGADEGIEAVDSGDEDSDGETEKDSSAQSAAGSTRNAGMAAVSSAMEAVVDRESSKREDVVRKALEGVDDMEKSSRRASIADTAAEDAEGLAEAVGMTAADASRLAAVAEADAKAAADAVEADAERAREDLELELREQRLEAIERKAKQAQLGVVAEMEEEVAKAATAKADALEAERQAADAEFREEQQDMRTAMAKRQEEAAAARESRLAELRGQLAAAQTAASTGAEGALETAKAAAAAAAELEATQEREEALAEAKAAVEASSADANAELEALAAAHQARMVELDESLAAEAAAARKALTAELSEKRDQQEAELEARQQAELEAAVDAAAREALVRGHAEERASLLAQLAEEEARKASSLEARLKAAGKDTETKRAALLKQHEEEVLKVDQRASANRDKQRAKLERQLEARRNRRAVAKAKKREEEIAKAEADAAAAEARGDLEAAERIRATIRAIHGAQDAAAPADAETHAAALAAAEKAAADASASAFQREAKIASANARADQAVAEVMRGLESMRQQGEAELLSGNREKAARKEEMIAARLATQVAAAGEDSAAAAAARARAAEDLRAHRSRLLQELEHEREVLSTKMAAAEAEAAAQVKLIRAKQADEVAALQLGFSQALGKALKGVQSEAEQKAASAQDRLADRRMARLHAIMAKAEAQRVAIQSDREKVASVSGGGVGAGGSSVAMDAVAAARAAALEAENEAERLRLAAEQAAERQRLEDEAEAAAATARQAAAEAAAAEQARLLDAKRAEQAAALARARGSAEELERIKAAQESEMAEYSAAMSANKADQLARTNAKLEARRARKRRALERKQEEERRAAEAAHGRAVAGVEAQAAAAREKEALAAVLADGSIGPDRKADAIEAVLGERHTRETAELLAAQYAERQTLYEEKRGDIAEAVSDLRAQGASDEDIHAAEAAISDAFTQKIAAAEAELDAELSGKHSGEKIELRQRQLAEVSDAFSSLAPEDILRRHEMQAEAEEAEELASFQREMEAQKEARLAELKAEQEAEEAMWREEQEAAMRALEEEHEQLLARQQESAARQRRHAEEVAAKEEAEARAAAAQAEGASEEERERIMAAYKEDALRRATAEEDERGRQEAAMKARLAKRRAAKQAKLQAKMEAKRKAMAEAGAAKFAQAVSTVRTNMGRTMSNLAERAKRRSMASMARLVPGAPGKSALRGRRGSMGGRLSARASVAGLGSARTSARLAAAASMRQAPGSTPLAAKYAAAKVDVGALMGRVDKLEQALSAIAARPNSLFTPGAVPAVATAVMSVKKGVADFAPAREDGVLQIVHDESGSLNHRQVQHLGFARTLVTLAGMDTKSLGDEGISLLPARAFPSSMSAANTFRSQYFFDHSRRPRRLYVRTAALDRVSTLYSNMNHLLAVIQHSPEDLSQDSSPEVIATLNRHLLLAGQQLFKSMAQASGGDFEQWAAAGAPAASAGVPPTGSAARPPTAATQSLALPLSGLKNTFSKGTPSARAVAGEGLGEEFSPESMADRLAAYKAAVSHKRKV
ncbi:unnamed protein product, partial [Symbiodinium sp. KB8]